MRTASVLSLAIWLLAANLVFAQKQIVNATKIDGSEQLFVANTTHGEVRILIESPVVYILDQPELYFRFLEFGLSRNGKPVEHAGSFFDIDGAAVAYSITSNDSKAIDIADAGEVGRRYFFHSEGTFSLQVVIGEVTVAVPVQVVRLKFKIGDSVDELVKALGFPSNKKRIFVSWPDLESHDGMIYRPEAGSADNVEHWRFDKLPHAVFAVRDNKVSDVQSHVLEKPVVVAEAAADTPEPEKQKDLREWTAKSGKKCNAEFVGYEAGKVKLKLEDDSEIEVSLRDFVTADQVLLKKLIKEMHAKK